MEQVEKQEMENQEVEKQEGKRQEFDKQKLLDILDIEKANQKFEDKKEVVLQLEYDGEMHNVVVYLDKAFSPTKMRICVEEFIGQIRHAKIVNIALDHSFYEIYMVFLIIKNFSSLELPVGLNEQIQIIYKMINNRILFPIFQEFDKKEIEKMNYELQDIIQRIDANADAIKEILEEKKLQNTDLLTADE